ncbi:MAG: endopeptidase La [Lachnospiraceae bacterium]|nr:endopeptidase La [Lachnospiraceae bacterium]
MIDIELVDYELPLVVVEKATVIPGGFLSVIISGDKNISASKKGFESDNKLVFVATKKESGPQPFFGTGTICEVNDVIDREKGYAQFNVNGIRKALIKDVHINEEYDTVTVHPEDINIIQREEDNDPIVTEALKRELRTIMGEYMQLSEMTDQYKRTLISKWIKIERLSELMESIVANIPIDYKIKQSFLELSSLNPRFEILGSTISNELNIERIKRNIDQRVRQNMDESHKKFVLKEQLKEINKELYGDDGETEDEEFTRRLEELDAPEEVKEKIEKEIKRFKKLSDSSPESNVSRTYINTLLDIPWETETPERNDLDVVQKVLDEEHYGLQKVKERIIDSLAVRNITNSGDVPIICLFGPPGTGKTSIAQSVAKALGKEYVRIALGGVKDEAEIRGHRRTYVGAIPGRIINGIIDAKVKNPLILFDEIDKVGTDYRSDTSAALLEVLDAEQNSHFVDHYVELPFDLSKALFICTANDLSTMSEPLLDRMEIIELNSYTENEKLHIANDHLIPKQLQKNGITDENLVITDDAISSIINEYTMEAGVRSLERNIATICRKAVRKLYNEGVLKSEKLTVSKDNLEEYLGRQKIHKPEFNHVPMVGRVHGLAWTKVGGTVIELEVNEMPGKGDLILTGQMGDVMKESARIALSFVRSIVTDTEDERFNTKTIHLHIPAGSVPKDGPSAGVTMSTAFYSVLTGKKVAGDVAMTGEVTLTGIVLPIGGLKEKLLAANKAGMTKVIVPAANRGDVEELDPEIIGDMKIVYAMTMDDVLKEAII